MQKLESKSRKKERQDMMQYRVVCQHHPEDGHQLHRWDKQNKRSAEQTVTDLNHKAEMDTGDRSFYAKCAPYTVETREVSEWTEAVE